MTTNPVDTPRVPTWTVQDGLRKAREWSGHDQGELAELMDVSRSTVSHYENGTRKPKRSTVIAWAFACNVEPQWLLGLPHLDSNQEPSDYLFSLVTASRHPSSGMGSCIMCGEWPCRCAELRPRAVVVDLAAYRMGRAS